MTISAQGHGIVRRGSEDLARRYALIALAALLVEEVVGSVLFIVVGRVPSLRAVPTIAVGTVLTHWVLPFLIVYLVERRDVEALGLVVPRGSVVAYGAFALIALVLPAFIVGSGRGLLLEFVEQMVYIGVAEEVFFRGYLTGRLCNWLGGLKGLLLSGLAFGLAHVVSRLSQHGFAYAPHDAQLGLQTCFGGIVFGLIYLRAGSIWPGTILHVATNACLGRFIDLLSS